MINATTYVQWRSLQLAPSWQQLYWGLRYNRTLGSVSDIQVNAAQQATGARLIATAPLDALPYAGQERSIERYPADTDSTYRARLLNAWELWSEAGTLPGMEAVLTAAGFVNFAIYDTHAGPSYITPWPPSPTGIPEPSWWPTVFPTIPWPPTAGAQSAQWAPRFWIVLSEPFPSFLGWTATHWGDGRTWGELGPDGSPYTWGSTATVLQVAWLRALIHKWRPSHAPCAGIYLKFSSGELLFWQGV